MSVLSIEPSHPALLPPTGLLTPPLTPTTPTKTTHITPTKPNVSYPMLRAHHATALKYMIGKLRWDQVNNNYLRGEDAWINHNNVIDKLEKELADCEQAQKGLDQFPNCYAAVSFPKQHGPLTKEKVEGDAKAEKAKREEMDKKLDEHYPWIKQLFIGPRTKNQARYDRILRDQMIEGDLDQEDLELLLPSENRRLLEGGPEKKVAGGGAGKEKKSYEQVRYEKEKAKIAALHDFPKKVVKESPRIGPMTKEEFLASLPIFGPPTKEEALLPVQRQQRQILLRWLQDPWGEYREEVDTLMGKLGGVALGDLEKRARAEAKKDKEKKEKEEKREKEKREKEKDKEEKKERK